MAELASTYMYIPSEKRKSESYCTDEHIQRDYEQEDGVPYREGVASETFTLCPNTSTVPTLYTRVSCDLF